MPAPLPVPLSRSRGWAVAAVVTLVMSVSYIDRQTLAALAPTVREALHVSHEQYGTVLAAFSVAYLFGAPIAGAVLDRTGARWGLVLAVLAWSAVAASHALVPGLAVLVGLRALLGVAEAPSFPGAVQTVRRVLPRTQRSAGIGLLFTGSSIGAMIAAPLAIAMNRWAGWRVAFLGTALVGLLWIPAWLLVTRRADVRAVLAPGMTEDAGPAPSRWKLLTSAPVARAVLIVVFTAPSIMFGLNWEAQYLADAYALKQDALAAYLWFPPLLFDLGAVTFGALASRADALAHGPRTHVALMGSAALLAAAMAAMPRVHDPWLATILCSASLAGGGGVFALLTADMLARVHPSHASTAGGLTAAAQSLAYVIANPLVGRAVDATHSYATVLLILGAIVPPAMLVWAAWPVSIRGTPEAAPSP